MNKKALLSATQKLTQLTQLPPHKLPSTLKTPIPLPNIQQVRLSYRPMCKNVGPSLRFVRQFGPAIRFSNPGLLVWKKPVPDGPLAMTIEVVRRGGGGVVAILGDQCKNAQEILGRIKDIDAK